MDYSVKYLNKPVDVLINPDDALTLVLKKLGYALGTDPNDIYVWTKHTLEPSTYHFLDFIENAFKGQQLIDIRSLDKYAFNRFGERISDTGSYKMISRDTALQLLRKLRKVTITQPVCHYFLDANFFEYAQYDPMVKSSEDTDEYYKTMYVHDMRNLTIQTAIGYEGKHVLHVAKKADIDRANHGIYFPNHSDEKYDKGKLAKFVSYLNESEKEFAAPSQVNVTEYLNLLYVKSKDAFNTQKDVDLAVLFNDFVTSEDVPFVKYKAYTNIYHKAHKKLLANAVEARDFEKWYAVTNFKMQDNTYIVFKIRCSGDNFASLILNSRMQIDIRFNFLVKDQQKLHTVTKHFHNINKVIQEIGKGVNLPLLPAQAIDLTNEFSIHRLVTFNESALDVRVSKANAETFVRNKMFQYFDVLPDEAANVLRLQYKKVDNFGKSENITFFIQRLVYSKEPKAAIIAKVVEFYGISEDDAEEEYDKWELQGQDEKNDKLKYEVYVEVKLRFNSPVDIRYIISGATSVKMNERINHLIGHLLAASTSKSKETKKDAEAKKLLQEEVHKSPVAVVPIAPPGGDDDDDDWMAELEAIEKEFAPPAAAIEEPQQGFVEDDGKIKLKGFVKRMLDAADRDLFNYKSEKKKRHDYASICGWVDRRQPVVISAAEKKEIDTKYPGAYEGFVKTGSTASLEAKNFYICPKIWCPKSRVAVSPDMYREKGAGVCPKGEDPILFESKSYWGLGDKALNRPHHPGFLDKHIRNDGLCLPCCFKIPPTEGNRNKQREELCVPKSEQVDGTDAVVDELVGTEKYIKNSSYFPLEIGRFGLVPNDIKAFLRKPNCGSRHNGTGLMTDKTDCYLRKGIYHGNQSFVHCMISLLENTSIGTYKEFIAALNKNLTLQMFMSIENGKILKLFIDRTKSIFSDDFKEFREWFLKDDSYVSRFNLTKLKGELQKHQKFTKEMSFYKDVIREFMIYYSYKNFMSYMNTHDIEKDHRILLDLFNICTDWLNVNEYNFVVLDVDKEGRVYIDCALNRDTDQFVNKKAPFIFLMRQSRYYEPFVHVKTSTNEDVKTHYKFDIADENHPMIRKMISFYYKNCSAAKASSNVSKTTDIDIPILLESKGYKPKYYVIDYDFRLTGVILLNNLYVPFFSKRDIFALKGLKFVYSTDIVTFKCTDTLANIRKVYDLLKREYGDFYRISEEDVEGEIVRSIKLGNGNVVPVNTKTVNSRMFLDDIFEFTGEQETDARLYDMNIVLSQNKEIKESLDKLEEMMDDKTRMEIMFLKDNRNPLPNAYKREKIISLLGNYLSSNVPKNLVMKITDTILNKFFEARKTSLKRFQQRPNEILFDYNDIQDGRLAEVIERAQNPYRLFHKKLNDVLDNYIVDDSEEGGEDFSFFINKESVFNDVPVKYGTIQYRKILKDFAVLQNDKDIVYKLISDVSRVTSQKALTIETLKGIVKTNITKDYTAKMLGVLESNPSFAHHLKKLRIKVPTLEAVMGIIDSMYYRPSFYELKILARAANVNIVVIGRQTLKNPQGLFEVIYTKSQHYLMLIQSFDRSNVVDNYQIIVKDKKDIIVNKRQLPVEIADKISAYLIQDRASNAK